jgi:hypothetical protein
MGGAFHPGTSICKVLALSGTFNQLTQMRN